MRALLLIAHGSRRVASNEEVQALAQTLVPRVNDRYQIVTAGFLEMAPPDIGSALQACVDQGADEIDVLPYFLSAGRHVATDVPEEVQAFAQATPGVTIKLLPYVGSVPGMIDLLVAMVSD